MIYAFTFLLVFDGGVEAYHAYILEFAASNIALVSV